MNLLLDIPPSSFWNEANGSSTLWLKIVGALVVSIFLLFAISNSSPTIRKLIVSGFTFIAGGFYVLFFLWPAPVNRKPDEMPSGFSERIAFNLADSLNVVANFTNILAGFLIGLGVYSLLRVHLRRAVKLQRDWQYSAVLLISMVLMTTFGYWNWYLRKFGEDKAKLDVQQNWHFANYMNDLLFIGLLQQMDAAMFSVIAFYILSAAYRAFRVRSIEATILLATALIVMLSLMGAVEFGWNAAVGPQSAFTLTEISKWLREAFQTPAIRGIGFGVGIGALAMGLRLWLSLERQGN